MEALRKKYLEAADAYIEKEKQNPDVIGIVVSGSLTNGTIDKNSDIDIHLILDPACEYRERGNVWVNDIEIEYFKNPPAQIIAYFEREKKSPHTAHMLAFGQIYFSKSSIVAELVSTAQSIMSLPPATFKEPEIEFEKYFLDDFYKDLEDAQINQDFVGAALIRHKIVNRSIDIFCKKHRIWRAKDKRLLQQLSDKDAHFYAIIESTLQEHWNSVSAISALRIYVEKMLGGGRSANWKLRSPLDI